MCYLLTRSLTLIWNHIIIHSWGMVWFAYRAGQNNIKNAFDSVVIVNYVYIYTVSYLFFVSIPLPIHASIHPSFHLSFVFLPSFFLVFSLNFFEHTMCTRMPRNKESIHAGRNPRLPASCRGPGNQGGEPPRPRRWRWCKIWKFFFVKMYRDV